MKLVKFTSKRCVTSFRGADNYLSNFYRGRPIVHLTLSYGTSEALFQALKTMNVADRVKLKDMSPGSAKRYGKTVHLRPMYESIKVHIMFEVLKMKFDSNPELRDMLLRSTDAVLIEGNNWNDKYWGMCLNGQVWEGDNNLGIALMQLRDYYSNSTDSSEMQCSKEELLTATPFLAFGLSDYLAVTSEGLLIDRLSGYIYKDGVNSIFILKDCYARIEGV